MENQLIKYEKDALEAVNNQNFQLAISLFEEIVRQNPKWEHGQAFCNLAGCYEDIGELERAEENYLNALNIQPDYYIFVGNYAGFLYQFGDPQIAFDWYLKLLKIESNFLGIGGEKTPDSQQIKRAKLGLIALGEKLGWSKDEVETRIANYLT